MNIPPYEKESHSPCSPSVLVLSFFSKNEIGSAASAVAWTTGQRSLCVCVCVCVCAGLTKSTSFPRAVRKKGNKRRAEERGVGEKEEAMKEDCSNIRSACRKKKKREDVGVGEEEEQGVGGVLGGAP